MPATTPARLGDSHSHTHNSQVVRCIDSTGIITTIAGNGTCAWRGDGLPATQASITYTYGVAWDSLGGGFWIAENANCVRYVSGAATRIISTVAGICGQWGYGGDGGPGTLALFSNVLGMAPDGRGGVYLVDNGNNWCVCR